MNKRRTRAQNSSRDETDTHLIFSLINTGRAVEQRLEEAMVRVRLSLAKFGALTHLLEAGEPMSLSECANRMTCVRSNITQLVDRLEAEDLVRRVEDPQDRRMVRAALTPLGIARQIEGAKELARVQGEMAEALDGIDEGLLRRALSAVRWGRDAD